VMLTAQLTMICTCLVELRQLALLLGKTGRGRVSADALLHRRRAAQYVFRMSGVVLFVGLDILGAGLCFGPRRQAARQRGSASRERRD
jgi:hypothetical protein